MFEVMRRGYSGKSRKENKKLTETIRGALQGSRENGTG